MRCTLAFFDTSFYGVTRDEARQILGELTDRAFDYLESLDNTLICPGAEFERATYSGP